MSYISIVIFAYALSVDAFIVAFSYGLTSGKKRSKNAMLISVFTGIFQALMPVLGYYLTGFVREYIQAYSSVIVFLIFVYLGGNFIIQAYIPEKKEKNYVISFKSLFLIGIATSIDAFSSGVSLLLYGNKILKPSVLFGLITFVNSLIGFYIGALFKYIPTKVIELSAGFLLIFLGVKALF